MGLDYVNGTTVSLDLIGTDPYKFLQLCLGFQGSPSILFLPSPSGGIVHVERSQ